MFHIHKWSKWEDTTWSEYSFRSGREHRVSGQWRECAKCGRRQTVGY